MSSQTASRFRHKLPVLFLAGLLAGAAISSAQTDNLYTKPHPGSGGAITGHVEQPLTHALALERDHTSCYRGDLSDGGKSFRITGLPTGKYDLILITKTGVVYEGVSVGDESAKLSPASLQHFEQRVNKADNFFNKTKVWRFGLSNEGETIFAFVERARDQQTLKQSGDVLNSNLRRLEVMELEKASDDWQMTNTRHIYREEAPLGAGMEFFKHRQVPELAGIRVIDSVKDVGAITLPPA